MAALGRHRHSIATLTATMFQLDGMTAVVTGASGGIGHVRTGLTRGVKTTRTLEE